MAGTLIKITTISLIFIVFFSILVTGDNIDTPGTFAETLAPEKLGLHRSQERLSHFRFYFHDSVNGENPTCVRVAKAATTDTSRSFFGQITMMDDPLTVQPDRASRLVGRAQGIYASASQSEIGYLMVLNFLFTEGKFNGSTLSVLGRNAIYSELREMPVVGGSGRFRFARGYAEARPYSFNVTTLDAVVQYDVHVFHH